MILRTLQNVYPWSEFVTLTGLPNATDLHVVLVPALADACHDGPLCQVCAKHEGNFGTRELSV
jgi:hypothetical protein